MLRTNIEKYMKNNIKTATYTHGSHARRDQQIYSKSKEVYQQQVSQFARYRKEQGYASKTTLDKAVEQARAYVTHLRDNRISENSINTTISALAKGLGVKQSEIGKADRTGLSTRGRGSEQYRNDINGRVCEFARAVGIRASEYGRLCGRDLTEKNGNLYVIVERGKGGKYQEQLILPRNEALVRSFFDGKGENDRIFPLKEINSAKHCNLHQLRRENAQEAYRHYEKLYRDPAERERAKDALKAVFNANKEKAGRFPAERMEKPYIVRNKDLKDELKATGISANGTLDRLALMSVAVNHLSHYREGVVVHNYMR